MSSVLTSPPSQLGDSPEMEGSDFFFNFFFFKQKLQKHNNNAMREVDCKPDLGQANQVVDLHWIYRRVVVISMCQYLVCL